MRQHKRFRHHHRATMRATAELLHAHPWSQNSVEQIAIAQRWVDTCARAYGIQAPRVRFDPYQRGFGGGYYQHATRTIALGNFSMCTLMHEFRHAMQLSGVVERVPANTMDTNLLEDDARAWSLSLFHRAAPRRFRRMVCAGRILYVTPAEL